MRAPAEIDKIALPVETYRLIVRNAGNNFRFVVFTDALKKSYCVIALPLFSGNTVILRHQLRHARFNCLKIFWGKGALERKIVIEAIINDRAYGYLGRWEKLLNGHGQQMGRRVTNNIEGFIGTVGDDGQ